jgi:hypothetical protein
VTAVANVRTWRRLIDGSLVMASVVPQERKTQILGYTVNLITWADGKLHDPGDRVIRALEVKLRHESVVIITLRSI